MSKFSSEVLAFTTATYSWKTCTSTARYCQNTAKCCKLHQKTAKHRGSGTALRSPRARKKGPRPECGQASMFLTACLARSHEASDIKKLEQEKRPPEKRTALLGPALVIAACLGAGPTSKQKSMTSPPNTTSSTQGLFKPCALRRQCNRGCTIASAKKRHRTRRNQHESTHVHNVQCLVSHSGQACPALFSPLAEPSVAQHLHKHKARSRRVHSLAVCPSYHHPSPPASQS